MKPDDILLWQDGFWCFREESDRVFLRNQYYRVIPCASDEGQAILAARETLRLRTDSAVRSPQAGSLPPPVAAQPGAPAPIYVTGVGPAVG